MASTIQVDKITDIGGNTMISSNGSGTFTNSLPAPTSGIAASAIDSGTIATARLGSGTASSSTFLRGDQTYAAAGGGKLLQTQQALFTSQSAHNTDSYTASNYTDQITPSATNSKIFVQFNFRSHIYQSSGNSAFSRLAIFRQINGGGFSQFFPNVADVCWGYNGDGSAERTFYSQPQISFIDTTHNTTTAIDYTLYASRNTSSSGNVNIGGSNHQAQVILMEISA